MRVKNLITLTIYSTTKNIPKQFNSTLHSGSNFSLFIVNPFYCFTIITFALFISSPLMVTSYCIKIITNSYTIPSLISTIILIFIFCLLLEIFLNILFSQSFYNHIVRTLQFTTNNINRVTTITTNDNLTITIHNRVL